MRSSRSGLAGTRPSEARATVTVVAVGRDDDLAGVKLHTLTIPVAAMTAATAPTRTSWALRQWFRVAGVAAGDGQGPSSTTSVRPAEARPGARPPSPPPGGPG